MLPSAAGANGLTPRHVDVGTARGLVLRQALLLDIAAIRKALGPAIFAAMGVEVCQHLAQLLYLIWGQAL